MTKCCSFELEYFWYFRRKNKLLKRERWLQGGVIFVYLFVYFLTFHGLSQYIIISRLIKQLVAARCASTPPPAALFGVQEEVRREQNWDLSSRPRADGGGKLVTPPSSSIRLSAPPTLLSLQLKVNDEGIRQRNTDQGDVDGCGKSAKPGVEQLWRKIRSFFFLTNPRRNGQRWWNSIFFSCCQ